jgi:hypothetical protein
MTSVWIWRITEYESPDASARDPLAGVDPTGYEVDASDGHIGKVDEATNDAGRGLLVVDTGFWIFGKKRMIPTTLVESVNADERRVVLSATKEQVKQAPDYDEARRDEAEYRDDVEASYRRR